MRKVWAPSATTTPSATIGLHEAQIVDVDGSRLQVRPLEAIDGTPVIDIKPVIGAVATR